MKGFRVAPEASLARHAMVTLAWIVVFWGLFLGVGPALIGRVEADWAGRVPVAPWEQVTAVIGFVLAGSLGLRSAWVMVRLGHGTPIPIDCARHLVVQGPYRVVRNPMAIAGLAQAVCVGWYLGSAGVMAYALTGGLVWNQVVRPREETDMEERFGEAFRRYRDAVPCWWPRQTSVSRSRAS